MTWELNLDIIQKYESRQKKYILFFLYYFNCLLEHKMYHLGLLTVLFWHGLWRP